VKREAADAFTALAPKMEAVYTIQEHITAVPELEVDLKKAKELLDDKKYLESLETSDSLLTKIETAVGKATDAKRTETDGLLEQLGILIVDKGGAGADISEIAVKFKEAKALFDDGKVLEAFTIAKFAKEALEAQGITVPVPVQEPEAAGGDAEKEEAEKEDKTPEGEGEAPSAEEDTPADADGPADDGAPPDGPETEAASEDDDALEPAGDADAEEEPMAPAPEAETRTEEGGPREESSVEPDDDDVGGSPETAPAEGEETGVETGEEAGVDDDDEGKIPGLKLVRKSESSKRLMDRIEKMRTKVIADHEAQMGPQDAKEALMKIKTQIVEAKKEGIDITEAEDIFRGVQPVLKVKEFDKAVKMARQALKVVNEERKKLLAKLEAGEPVDIQPDTTTDSGPAEEEPAPSPEPAPTTDPTPEPAEAPPTPPEPAAEPERAPAPEDAPEPASAQEPASAGPEEAGDQKDAMLIKKAKQEMAEAVEAIKAAKAGGKDVAKAMKYISLSKKAQAKKNYKKIILIARKAKEALAN